MRKAVPAETISTAIRGETHHWHTNSFLSCFKAKQEQTDMADGITGATHLT